MRNCERCDGEASWTNDVISLTGGYLVHLCTGCERDLNDIVLDSDEGRERDLMEARHEYYQSLALAGRPVTLEEWEEQVREKTRIDQGMCRLIRLFLAEKPVTVDRKGA